MINYLRAIKLQHKRVKKFSYLLPCVFIDKVKGRGRGVFTHQAIPDNTVVEIAPVIVMSAEDRKHIDSTLLHDYIFEWGETRQQCCMALGYVPMYNHAAPSNCEYEMNFRKQIITVRTVRAIAAGEELFINYHGDADNTQPVWFEMK